MRIYTGKSELQEYIQKEKQNGKSIGFVPTMGALHEGHMSLVQHIRPLCDILVCSIFVNPTQFNDPKDLEKYPVTTDADISLLTEHGCDIVFLPSTKEMYPADEETWSLDLGPIESIWEGEHRPGHFQGVAQIVYKLFDLVQPDRACFGQKDFQQVMVIKKLIELKKLPIHLDICPTKRDENGLALSSRNQNLSEEGRQKASRIYKALSYIQDTIHNEEVHSLLKKATEIIEEDRDLKIEYLSICETENLKEIKSIQAAQKYVILVAAWLEGVRLIDNKVVYT